MKLWQILSPNLLAESKKLTEGSGVFLPLPKEISEHYPSKKEDSSPQHITIIYFGNIPSKDRLLYRKAVQNAVNKIDKIGECEIGKKKYMNHENQTIAYNPIKCEKLKELRKNIIKNCKEMNLEIKDEFKNEYVMHTTIAYLDKGSKCDEEGYSGKFNPTNIEIWGFEKNMKIELE